ncbi:hypothetical protein OZX69_02965 [Lactobacillus sp. ESL0731]|uniref:hypothetical protein n=1 Tax=unclassified Lactobacillus TaxID=2620435 RepID=UPI0023F7D60B|nr:MULTISPECIES: hypothetical protein [unclassified Lactobacillus]WEV51671.1 hypothetical protein OZX63_02965 [Lactobacillus sp. ESL0700]WEV62800.1 hypothetical protein OZX69_02965 [Lactobacillus sp. ESL0731]
MSMFGGLTRAAPLLWHDKATITGKRAIKHDAITDSETVTIVSDEPCKVILKGQKASTQSFFGTDEYDAELLIRTGIDIPAGSRISVTDINGKVVQYKRASKGYTGYASHQELAMVRDEKA